MDMTRCSAAHRLQSNRSLCSCICCCWLACWLSVSCSVIMSRGIWPGLGQTWCHIDSQGCLWTDSVQLVLQTRHCGSLYRPTSVCDKDGLPFFLLIGWLDPRLPFPQSTVRDSSGGGRSTLRWLCASLGSVLRILLTATLHTFVPHGRRKRKPIVTWHTFSSTVGLISAWFPSL